MLNNYKEKVMEEGEQECGRYFDRFNMHVMEGAYGASFPTTKEELLKYIKQFISDLIDECREDTLRQVLPIIRKHEVGEGRYCDTGEDMNGDCRSECVDLAIQRLFNKAKEIWGIDLTN